MENPHHINFVCTNQERSKGGSAAAKNMTAEQRRERALKGTYGRKCYQGLPKAKHSGELIIGDLKISCAVLEDGTALVNRASILQILGKGKGGSSAGRKPKAVLELEKELSRQIPSFLAVSNIIPFIKSYLSQGGTEITYIHPKQGKSMGFKAEIIPQICDAYLIARREGVLTKDQVHIAVQSEIINSALAKVGISSLIYECTGFDQVKDINALQNLFEKFIAKELQPWTRRFPSMFFENIKRMYGLEHLKGNPQFAGHLINRYIYRELSEEVLDELKKRNPITDGGYRKHAHHQLLTTDIGHPALEKQIIKVNTLMSASDSKEDFEMLFEKTKR